jgi:hypothetical protein
MQPQMQPQQQMEPQQQQKSNAPKSDRKSATANASFDDDARFGTSKKDGGKGWIRVIMSCQFSG